MGSDLTGRLVLITGASAGIGRAAAIEFAARGARVIGVARRAGPLEALARELGGHAIVADVAEADSMEAMASRVLTEIGVPDVIVANAGVGLDALFAETTDELLRAVFEVNVFGVVRTVRPFVPALTRRGSGRILIVSSIVGRRGIPHYSGYSASKFALRGMADALRSELWGSGVTVGVLYPVSTVTEFHGRVARAGPGQRRHRPRRHPPESVARAMVRLARSQRRELVLSFEGRLMVLANALAPGLLDGLLARMLLRKS